TILLDPVDSSRDDKRQLATDLVPQLTARDAQAVSTRVRNRPHQDGANPMATREQVRHMQTAQPFRPFLVRVAGGRTFTIRHPELVSCSFNGREMVIHDEEGMHLVEMLLVEVLEPVN